MNRPTESQVVISAKIRLAVFCEAKRRGKISNLEPAAFAIFSKGVLAFLLGQVYLRRGGFLANFS